VTNYRAPTFHSQLVLPQYFDPLLKHFVFFQEPDKTKNIQPHDKSVTITRKEITAHNHLNKTLPIILYDPGTTYHAYFEEPEVEGEKVASHASADNISQIYKTRRRRRTCKRFDTKTNSVLSLDC
jgi:hypothetical protein